MPESFRKFLAFSVGFHIVFLLLILYSPSLFDLLPHKKTKITWIKLTKGTGEQPSDAAFKKAKGMPESTLREQKEALKEKAKDKKGKDKKSLESPVKKKPPVEEYSQKRASPDGAVQFKSKPGTEERKMEEALARVEQQLEKRKVEIEAAQIEKEGTGQSPYGSLDVTQGETNPVLVAYYEAVKRKINEQWITTPKQVEAGIVLKTQINVMIDSLGKLIEASYETRSGDSSFDLSAMRAVERAAPFPPPPQEIKDETITEGFLIEFNPRNVVGSF